MSIAIRQRTITAALSPRPKARLTSASREAVRTDGCAEQLDIVAQPRSRAMRQNNPVDIAATHDMQAGSRWRPMSDTTKDPIIAARAPLPWPSWQRSEDYYTEGALASLRRMTRFSVDRAASGD